MVAAAAAAHHAALLRLATRALDAYGVPPAGGDARPEAGPAPPAACEPGALRAHRGDPGSGVGGDAAGGGGGDCSDGGPPERPAERLVSGPVVLRALRAGPRALRDDGGPPALRGGASRGA
eukprot:7192772-Alexandrium_andersonii.AAC.1